MANALGPTGRPAPDAADPARPVSSPAAPRPGSAHGDRALPPWAAGFPGVVLVLDAKGGILASNRGLSGLDPAEVVDVDLAHFVPEAEQGLLRAALQDAAQLGLPHALDLALLDAGGKTSTLHLAAVTPFALPSGKPGVLLTALDITRRERETERLRQAERMMVDGEGITHIGTWYWDITQPNAQWSDELYNIYGLDPATHVPTYQDYLTRIHPEDVERVKSATEAVFKDRKPYSHDERIRHSDGTWRWLHTWARAIEAPDGKLIALAGVCQDITDRKRAEADAQATQARFHALFERSALGVAILDDQGRILEANAALRNLTDLPQDDLSGRLLETLFDPASAPACRTTLKEMASGGATGRQLDLLLHRPATPLEIRLTLAIVRGAPGTPPFTVAIAEDRTLAQRALAADQLAVARLEELRQVEEAGERHRQLLHVASHELKNPLTPVRMQLHMLEQNLLGPLNDQQKKAVNVATKQIQRITRLLQDVLDVARIEQGQLTVRPERMDAATALRRVDDAFRDVATEWGVTLNVTAPPGLWVDADPERLEQILVNLVNNALKFTPKGGRVDVAGALDGNQVLLRVHDTGPGMDPNQQTRLFKAFSQVHAAGAARQGGTGLGLYIARNLTQSMSGTIEVDSAPGKGSTFTVRLPKVTAPTARP